MPYQLPRVLNRLKRGAIDLQVLLMFDHSFHFTQLFPTIEVCYHKFNPVSVAQGFKQAEARGN
jgi:hypothetical protein